MESQFPSEIRAHLDRRIAGTTLTPGEPGYDAATEVWNARFTSTPDLVVRCREDDDVVTALETARKHGLPLTVKSGGHDYGGHSAADGGLLVDLSPMDHVEVDAEGRRVTVGPGALWRDVDGATQAHGLATTGGTVSTVGVAGFTLGGGEGWLSRRVGHAVDNLLAARVVTAAGEVVRASADENPDLFWGLRGGGGNLGVLTSLELRLHPVGPKILAGQVMYPLERAPELLRFYRRHMEEAPDEVGCYPFFLKIPPIPEFPESMHGQVVLDFVVAWTGDFDDGEAGLAPFREQGDPILDAVVPTAYADFQTAFDAGMGKGNRWYSRALDLPELTDEAAEILVEGVRTLPGAFTTVYLTPLGGAATRVPTDATAYPHREPGHRVHVFPGWSDPADDEEVMAWARKLHGRLRPHGRTGMYLNLLAEDEEGRVQDAWGENRSRLARLKARWDPDGLLQPGRTVGPAG